MIGNLRSFLLGLALCTAAACVGLENDPHGRASGTGGREAPASNPGSGGQTTAPAGTTMDVGTDVVSDSVDARPVVVVVDGGSSDTASADAGSQADLNAADAGGTCPLIIAFDPTVGAFETDIVARLSGATDITPGVRLANRSTSANRVIARAYLKRLLQDLALTPEEHAYGSGINIFASLPATNGSQETVVFGAHYDTVLVAPGANDNATGVAAVLAVARFAQRLTCRARRLIFVWFDEEEVGLVGSKQFAAKLRADAASVHSVHTIDQMGWDMNGDRLIEPELPDAGLRDIYEQAVRELAVTIPIKTTTTKTTDHASFRPTFPAVGITEGYTSGDTTPFYHRAGDAFATVNFPYLASTTILMNQVVADLVRR